MTLDNLQRSYKALTNCRWLPRWVQKIVLWNSSFGLCFHPASQICADFSWDRAVCGTCTDTVWQLLTMHIFSEIGPHGNGRWWWKQLVWSKECHTIPILLNKTTVNSLLLLDLQQKLETKQVLRGLACNSSVIQLEICWCHSADYKTQSRENQTPWWFVTTLSEESCLLDPLLKTVPPTSNWSRAGSSSSLTSWSKKPSNNADQNSCCS